MAHQTSPRPALARALWSLCLAVLPVCLPTAALGNQGDPAPLPPPAAPNLLPGGVAPAAFESTVAELPRSEAARQDAPSEPERIARLQRTVQTDDQRLSELKRLLEDPQGEYAKAEAAFNALDGRFTQCKKDLQDAVASGDLTTVDQQKAAVLEIEKKWELAKKAFQVAIDERKAHQASIATLIAKIERDQEALERLRGNEPVAPTPAAAPAPPPVATPGLLPGQPPQPPSGDPSRASLAPGTLPPAAAAVSPALDKSAPAAVAPAAPAAGETPPSGSAAPAANGRNKPDERVQKAEQVAAKSVVDAQHSEQTAARVTERVEILRRDIELQGQLRTMARRKIDVARDELAQLNTELTKKIEAGEELTAVHTAIREAQNRMVSAQVESRQLSDRLNDLQTELDRLQTDQIVALKDADLKRQQADAAQKAVADLNNPFTVHNILRWLADHGVAIVAVLGILAAVLWAGNLVENRLVSLIAFRSARGSKEERKNRAKTLVSVLHNALRTVAIGTAAVLVLDECGVAVGPILGGAAVVGLAAAFGAQSLIKDYFTGFMVLMEQQYMIGDVLQIGEIKGQVERITLRMTVLRDLEGKAHFIPHGQINTVTNMTHEWSRVVCDIGVAYKENVDRVIEVLLQLGTAMHADPQYQSVILDAPVMLGVDAFADSAVIIRLTITTRPLRQWEVKRELLRRIKNRFDELGIEIPFPHRTVYFAENQALMKTAPLRNSPSAGFEN